MPSDAAGGLAVDWPFARTVRAVMSTRQGGVSAGRYAAFNLGDHVGDEPQAVAANRERFGAMLQVQPAWLNQVHGNAVVDAADVLAGVAGPADAVVTTRPGIACAVLVADCLPVLMADDAGRCVAAAHAGWRGLAAGVLENTLATVCRDAGVEPESVVAWLGPCIGPSAFEVGDEVREAFGAASSSHFVPHIRRDGSSAWLADLPGLARQRLSGAGIRRVSGGRWCTVSDPDRFFSYRRDSTTGRMAAAIAIVPG